MQKNFVDSNFNEAGYWQNINFSLIYPKFYIVLKIVILKVYLEINRPTASALLWQGHVQIYLFHFWQSWAFKSAIIGLFIYRLLLQIIEFCLRHIVAMFRR